MKTKMQVTDLRVVDVKALNPRAFLLKLTDDTPLPLIHPGQFAELRVDGHPQVYLRRPISIHFVDRTNNELWLLIQKVGNGTQQLSRLQVGDHINVLFPLGNGFRAVEQQGERVLLIGGGVGVAPLLEYGKYLTEHAAVPTFLLGGRSAGDILQVDEFRRYGEVWLTTEDGSAGERGYVTQHSLLQQPSAFDRISCCGPKPMMQAVVQYARQRDLPCEVSLENQMACGLGACLCCVEKTIRGNVCVCKEGPVFDIHQLNW